jgi:hypothetical protein
MPSYNGANNSTDPLVTPWNISGWTAQAIPADTVQVSADLFAASPLPATLIYAQVNASYFDFDNNPMSGLLTFSTSEAFTITSGGKSYRVPARYAGRDNATSPGGMNNFGTGRIYIRLGLMSVTLMCTDATGLVTDSGLPLTYHVVEHFMGGQQFDISLPSATISPTDLRSLIVPGSITTYAFDPADPMANEGYVPIIPPIAQPADNDSVVDGGTAWG